MMMGKFVPVINKYAFRLLLHKKRLRGKLKQIALLSVSSKLAVKFPFAPSGAILAHYPNILTMHYKKTVL